MNRLLSFKYSFFFIFLLTCSTAILSQVVVERSKEKVVIAGVTYYLHPVRKGETAYSISKAYGITTDELTKYNPSVSGGLKEGQSLKIPERLVSNSVPPATQAEPAREIIHDDGKFIYHKLKPGETIYNLSRTYGVTENDIIKSNPGIDITKLSLGTELAIPRKADLKQQKNEVAVQRDPDAYYHKVIRGETLASIAEKYGLTLRDIRRENKDIKFPQVGDYIKIPGLKAPAKPVVTPPPPAETVPVVTEDPLTYFEKPSEFTPVKNLGGSFNMAVLLPFYLNENSRRYIVDSTNAKGTESDYQMIRMNDDWIYDRSIGFIEMYEGILLAADTLRSLGLDINIHTFDIKNDTIDVTRLIRSGKLQNMDLIIGPVHSKNLALVASYAGNLGIPVVSPVPLMNNSVLDNNPTLFKAVSSIEVAQAAIAGKVKEYSDNNIILVHSGSVIESQDTKMFKNLIVSELKTKIPEPDIKVKELVFYSRSVKGDSVRQLSDGLSDKSGNVVIIASEDDPLISETIMNIHNLSRKYDIKAFGYPYIRNIKNLDPKYFFDLGMMIYSPYWIEYTNMDVKQFNADFRSKFLTEPSEESFAWEGYDIAYYFISGLAIHGKQFLKHPEMHNPDLLQTGFDFRRSASNDGFENKKLFLIRYTKNYELKLVNDAGEDSIRE